jgi:hypothetical protein
MSAGTGDEYRPTYFDKHGPEGADHGGLVGAPLGGAGMSRALSPHTRRSLLRHRTIRSRASVRQVAAKDDIYASNRLVDIYLAWPGHEMKGLRELRRLIDTYPETDLAERARAGLVNLKSQLGVTE